jgi:hypothetical protein
MCFTRHVSDGGPHAKDYRKDERVGRNVQVEVHEAVKQEGNEASESSQRCGTGGVARSAAANAENAGGDGQDHREKKKRRGNA